MNLFYRKASKSERIQEMLREIKEFLKSSTAVKAMCWRYDSDPDCIDDAPIEFDDLPVSAKTKNKKIYINNMFLEEGDFSKEIHYIVHELCHWLQQTKKDPHDLIPYVDDDLEYLDYPSEHEAFMFQVQFMREMYGDEVAEEYVDELLDFHEITGERKEEKRRQLLAELDDSDA